MKRSFITKIKVGIVALLGFSTFSCTEFLTEDPMNYILIDEYFETEDDALQAIYPIYQTLFTQYRLYWPVIDVGTDDVYTSSYTSGMYTFADHAITGGVAWYTSGNTWEEWWEGICQANLVINFVPDMDNSILDDDYKNELIAEAMCMRAFYYFQIVRTWGNAPMITWWVRDTNYDYTASLDRSPVEDIYDQIIIPDLVFASEYAPSAHTEQVGRATKWLARTLLSEVYANYAGYRLNSLTGALYRGDQSNWLRARDAAASVIFDSECPHSLILDAGIHECAYAAVWDTEYNAENILEVTYINESGFNNTLPSRMFAETGYNPSFWSAGPLVTNSAFTCKKFQNNNVNGWYMPMPDLYHAFEDGDERKWGMMTRYEDGTTNYLCSPTFRKYMDYSYSTAKESYSARNFIIYRYADAMLLYAEADNEYQGPTYTAIDVVNQIRNRAGLADLTSEQTADQDSFREAIHKERRVEFHGEAKRRFDLIRWNKAKSETEEIERTWLQSDNMISDDLLEYATSGVTSHVSADYIVGNMYVPTAINQGCTTADQMPLKAFLLPIPTTELDACPHWYDNPGY
ncbi:MAG: RagB/SusD family nutrient uptake outer membrane protein [Rikenellaceae bacterium]